jgi:hypothetical protein
MKPLKRTMSGLHHYKNETLVGGPNAAMWGDCTGMRGDCTGMRGNCSELWGDCSELSGDCSGLLGDLDEIPESARPCDIADWVEEV